MVKTRSGLKRGSAVSVVFHKVSRKRKERSVRFKPKTKHLSPAIRASDRIQTKEISAWIYRVAFTAKLFSNGTPYIVPREHKECGILQTYAIIHHPYPRMIPHLPGDCLSHLAPVPTHHRCDDRRLLVDLRVKSHLGFFSPYSLGYCRLRFCH